MVVVADDVLNWCVMRSILL